MITSLTQLLIDTYGELESVYKTMAILGYEWGDFQKCVTYADESPDLAGAYIVEAKITLSDLLAQVQLLCERYGWDFIEVASLGKERMFEKVREKAREK